MLKAEEVQDEKHLRARIKNCLAKKHHGHTAPEVNYIYDSLEAAYKSGIQYDVSDMRKQIKSFALNSTNQAKQCMRLVGKMRFKSKEYEAGDEDLIRVAKAVNEVESAREAAAKGAVRPLVIFDIEVFPNLTLVCWKKYGKDEEIISWFNPTAEQIGFLMEQRLVGFNNRAYDNHILYAVYLGKKPIEVYHISKDIIDNKFGGFGPAYRISEAVDGMSLYLRTDGKRLLYIAVTTYWQLKPSGMLFRKTYEQERS